MLIKNFEYQIDIQMPFEYKIIKLYLNIKQTEHFCLRSIQKNRNITP